jgi:hypothetical protein
MPANVCPLFKWPITPSTWSPCASAARMVSICATATSLSDSSSSGRTTTR